MVTLLLDSRQLRISVSTTCTPSDIKVPPANTA
jgi:hypothetical protein